MPNLERVLVPTDFSECSRAALDYALLLARKIPFPIDVLHVIRQPPAYVGSQVMVDISGHSRQSLGKFAESQAKKEMNSLVSSLAVPVDISVRHCLKFGDPTREILLFAKKQQHDMIIMGTNGRTGLSHFLLGSVAEKVVRRAPCPILTVRGKYGPITEAEVDETTS